MNTICLHMNAPVCKFIIACTMHILHVYLLPCLPPELDECDPNPCLNGGTCLDGVRNYTCNCTSDNFLIYTGRNCGTGEKKLTVTVAYEMT